MPSRFLFKPSGAHDINRQVAREYGMETLWAPDERSQFFNIASEQYDRIQPERRYLPAIAGRYPFVDGSESGIVHRFDNAFASKTLRGRSWHSESAISRISADGMTLFAVVTVPTTLSSTSVKNCVAAQTASMAYKSSTNELVFSVDFGSFLVTLPFSLKDGKEHSLVITYLHAGVSPRLHFYMDGEFFAQRAGPTSASTIGSYWRAAVGSGVGSSGQTGEAGSWNGQISLAGSANYRWGLYEVARFAANPFEVLHQPRRQRKIVPATTPLGIRLEAGGNVTQFLVEAAGNTERVLVEVGGETPRHIAESVSQAARQIAENGGAAPRILVEAAGQVPHILVENAGAVPFDEEAATRIVTLLLREIGGTAPRILVEVGDNPGRTLVESGGSVPHTTVEDGGQAPAGTEEC